MTLRAISNIYRFMLFVSFIIGSNRGAGQQPLSKKDSGYIFLLRSSFENGRPIASYIFINNIDSIATLGHISNRDSFVCTLFRKSIYFEEPGFTLEKNIEKYKFAGKAESKDFLSTLYGKVINMNSKLVGIGSKKIKDSPTIDFDCVKLIGDFWLLSDAGLNNLSHSFYVDPFCYSSKYIYNLKDIEKVERLSGDEIRKLKKCIGLQ